MLKFINIENCRTEFNEGCYHIKVFTEKIILNYFKRMKKVYFKYERIGNLY